MPIHCSDNGSPSTNSSNYTTMSGKALKPTRQAGSESNQTESFETYSNYLGITTDIIATYS